MDTNKLNKLANTTIKLVKFPDDKFPHNVHENLKIETEVLENAEQKLKPNQVLVESLYLSVDPTMRVWMTGQKTYIGRLSIGQVFPTLGVGRVLISKSKKFNPGDVVLGMMTFQSYPIVDAKTLRAVPKEYQSPQNFLGVLGINGLTAYVGLIDIGKPKEGQTVVVSTAAGAVGEIVCQLAKLQGCRVVGIAGGKAKCDYVVNTLGADACIDYKDLLPDEKRMTDALKKNCPKGVDVYFDNVGGRMLDSVLNVINEYARIIACGAISTYNHTTKGEDMPSEMKVKNYPKLILKNAKMQGFLYFDHKEALITGFQYLMGLIQEGKLKYNEDVTKGIENTHDAFKKLFTGKNKGKTIVQVASERASPKL